MFKIHCSKLLFALSSTLMASNDPHLLMLTQFNDLLFSVGRGSGGGCCLGDHRFGALAAATAR